jgi:hypothetical protein
MNRVGAMFGYRVVPSIPCFLPLLFQIIPLIPYKNVLAKVMAAFCSSKFLAKTFRNRIFF